MNSEEPNYIYPTILKDVYIVERPTFNDARGFFRETFRKSDLAFATGWELDFLQANHSHSVQGTLRGIHIAPWHKLVTCVRGTVQQVVVDTRPESPTFKKHISVLMGDHNKRSVFIPAHCGNAFLVISDIADYQYLTTEYWRPGVEKNIQYNDSEIDVHWMNPAPLVSEKDSHNPSLKEVFPPDTNFITPNL